MTDPSEGARWQRDDLRGLTTNLTDPGLLKGATLQEESLNLNRSIGIHFARLEATDKLQLVNGHLVEAGRLLAEGIEERLRVEKVRDAKRISKKITLLDALDPLHELGALLAKDTDPGRWVLWAFPHLLP